MKQLLLLFCITLNLSSVAQPAYFQNNFGSTGFSNSGGSVAQAPTGSLFFIGNFSDTLGNHGFELYKLQNDGAIVWQQQTFVDLHVNKIIYTSANHLLINGQITDSVGNTDACALLIDTNGNQIFFNSYGKPITTEMFMGLDETADKGYIFCGFTSNTIGPGNACYVVKTDSNGITQWQQTYSYPVNSVSDDIVQTPEGNYVLSSDKKTQSANYNAQVLKLDSTGNVIWQTDLVFPYNGGCKNLIINSEGFYIVIGESATASSSYFDPFISKLDTGGNIIWSHTIQCSNGPDAGYDIIEPSPNNYLITGFGFDTVTSNTDLLIMRLDSLGNEVNKRYYGGPLFDQGYTIINSVYNNGFIAAGFSNLNPDSKYLLVYDDYLGIPMGINELRHTKIILFPCPADEQLNFATDLTSGTALVHNITGQLIYKNPFDSFTKTINTSLFNNGIYFLTIDGQIRSHQKFMVAH